MERIVAATDGSESATRALGAAARLAKQLGAELLIVTIGKERLSADEIREARHQGMSEGEALEMLSDTVLADARKRARELGSAHVEVLHCVGDAAQVLLDVAHGRHADMIVVGRRGRGRLAGLVLGSVSQKLASRAPCSVVIVP
jgi:nucleotide-binding universal stress UspA family protein